MKIQFHDNVSSLAGERSVQDSVAVHYEAQRYRLAYAACYHAWWMDEMIAMASVLRPGSTVLDDGCGTGHLIERLSDAKVIGLDLSNGMLRQARKRSSCLVQGDSQRLPLPDAQFDLVIARSLLHHLPDPRRGIAEIYRVLKPGGQVVVADTNRSLLNTLPRKLAYRSEHFSEGHQNLDRREYLTWLERYFRVERVRYFGYLAYPFGFPDMMGALRFIPFPVPLVKGLIRIDNVLARIPALRVQSWGIMVVGSRL
jgi:ubiquinone/menaquinone biosynthesis C-methylase UbiE